MFGNQARHNAGLVFVGSLPIAAAAVAMFHAHRVPALSMALLATLCVLGAVVLASRPHSPQPSAVTAIDCIATAFTAWLTLAVFFSVAPAQSLSALGLYLLLPAAYLIVRVSPATAEPVIALLVAGAAALSLWALVLRMPTLGFPNSNNFAALLAVGMLACAAWTFDGPRARRAGLLAVTVLIATGVAFTGSRGALVGAGVASAALFIAERRAGRRWPRLLAPLAAMAVGFVAANVLSSGYASARVASLLVNPIDTANAERLLIWKTSFPLAFERPLTGFGPGMTEYVWSPLREPLDGSSGYYLHNDYLQYAVDGGWLATALLVALGAAALWTLLRRTRTSVAVRAAATAAVALFVHALFDFHFQTAALLIVAGLMLGTAAAGSPQVWRPGLRISAVPAVTVLLVIAAVAGMAGYQRSLVDAAAMPAPGSTAYARLKNIELAVRLRPDDPHAHAVRAAVYRQMHARMPDGDPNRQAAYQAALESADRAIMSNPFAPWAYYERGRLAAAAAGESYAVGGAEADLRHALMLRAVFVEARLALGSLLAAQGRDADSAEVLAEGLRWHQFDSPVTGVYLLQTAASAEKIGDFRTSETARQMFRERFGSWQ